MSKSVRVKGRASRLILGAAVVALVLPGCSGLSKAVGNAKQSPDEFAVVTKAPLVIPPDFSLRPPRPGARRPQEGDPSKEAAAAVFGSGEAVSAAQTDGERTLLMAAGAQDADNSIRDLIDSEYFAIHRPDKGFANKILFWKGETVDPSTVVDDQAESKRIRENQDLGKPVTEGETPTLD